MGNKVGGQKTSKSKDEKRREKETTKRDKEEEKSKKKTQKKEKKETKSKKTKDKDKVKKQDGKSSKQATSGRDTRINSGSEFDTDFDSSHATGWDSESGVFHSAENISTSPYLDSHTRSELEHSGTWSALYEASATSRHPQVLSTRDFRDGFSLEACIPPEIARRDTYHYDHDAGSGGAGGSGSHTFSYSNSSSLKSKRSNSSKSSRMTPTSSKFRSDDRCSVSTSSSQRSGMISREGFSTPMLTTPVFGRTDRSHSGVGSSSGASSALARVQELDRDSMDIVSLTKSPYDPNVKIYTTYDPPAHLAHLYPQETHPIDYRNLPKPSSPYPQRRALSPKMTSPHFKLISSDDSSSCPSTPVPQRKATKIIADLLRSGRGSGEKKKKHRSRSRENSDSDDNGGTSVYYVPKQDLIDEGERRKSKGLSMWKTWERSSKKKSGKYSKISIFGTSRKKPKTKSEKKSSFGDCDANAKESDRMSDSTLKDLKITPSSTIDPVVEKACKQYAASANNKSPATKTKSSTSSYDNSSSKGEHDFDYWGDQNRNSSPPVAKSAAFCIMRLEELERNIEKTIREKFPDAEAFLIRKRTPPDDSSRGSKSLPTTPSPKKKLFITNEISDISMTTQKENVTSTLEAASTKLGTAASIGATRYYDETFEESASPAMSPVVLRRFGARTRHASLSPKIQRAKTAALYNSPSEMERVNECASPSRPDSPSLEHSSVSNQAAKPSFSSPIINSSKYPNSTSNKAINLSQGQAHLLRQKRIELSESEDDENRLIYKLDNTSKNTNNTESVSRIRQNSGNDSPDVDDHSFDKPVIVPSFSAVFGSVSPKLKRHLLSKMEDQCKTNEKSSSSAHGNHDAAASRKTVEKVAVTSDANSPQPKRQKQIGLIQTRLKDFPKPTYSRSEPQPPRVADLIKAMSGGRVGSEEGGGGHPSYSQTRSPVQSTSAIGSPTLSSSPSPSSSAHQSPGWLHSRSHLRAPADSSKQDGGHVIAKSTTQKSSVTSPGSERKHSTDHVIFGSAVALPCRIYSPPPSPERKNATNYYHKDAIRRNSNSRENDRRKNSTYDNDPVISNVDNSNCIISSSSNNSSSSSNNIIRSNNSNNASLTTSVVASSPILYAHTPAISHTYTQALECHEMKNVKSCDGKGGQDEKCANQKSLTQSEHIVSAEAIAATTNSNITIASHPSSLTSSTHFGDTTQLSKYSRNNCDTMSVSSGGISLDSGKINSNLSPTIQNKGGSVSKSFTSVYMGNIVRPGRVISSDNNTTNSDSQSGISECTVASTSHDTISSSVDVINDNSTKDLSNDTYVPTTQKVGERDKHKQTYKVDDSQTSDIVIKQPISKVISDIIHSRQHDHQIDHINPQHQQLEQQNEQPYNMQQQTKHQEREKFQYQSHTKEQSQSVLSHQKTACSAIQKPSDKYGLVVEPAVATVISKKFLLPSLVLDEKSIMDTSSCAPLSLDAPETTDEAITHHLAPECNPSIEGLTGSLISETSPSLSSERYPISTGASISKSHSGESSDSSSDIDSFLKNVQASDKVATATKITQVVPGQSSPTDSTVKQNPPPPSPTIDKKVTDEILEEEEEEENVDEVDEVHENEDNTRCEKPMQLMNLALVRQNEIRLFSDEVCQRLSALLSSQTGSDEVFVGSDKRVDDSDDDNNCDNDDYRNNTKREKDKEDIQCEDEDDVEEVFVKSNDREMESAHKSKDDLHDHWDDPGLLSEPSEDQRDDNGCDTTVTSQINTSSMLKSMGESIRFSTFSTSSSLSTSTSSSSSSSEFFAPSSLPPSGKRHMEVSEHRGDEQEYFTYRRPENDDDGDCFDEDVSKSQREAHSKCYHSDDDVARGGGIPEYYDDRPLWKRRQKPPGQISIQMAAQRRRERRERWLKKRRRNRTDILNTGTGSSDNQGSETSLPQRSRLSIGESTASCENDEEELYLQSSVIHTHRREMESDILSSPKYTKPIMPFLSSGIGSSRLDPEPVEEPAIVPFTSSSLNMTAVPSARDSFFDDTGDGHVDSSGGRDSSMTSRSTDRTLCEDLSQSFDTNDELDEASADRASNETPNPSGGSHANASAIPGLEETFVELQSVKQMLEELQERVPLSMGGSLAKTMSSSRHSESASSHKHPGKLMPLTVENIKTMKEFYKDSSIGRRSRLSNTDRTESDLDLFSEYRDDVSTDSNLYADDEDDDDNNEPYATADDDISGVTPGDDNDDEDFLVSCTFYNSKAVPLEYSNENAISGSSSKTIVTSVGAGAVAEMDGSRNNSDLPSVVFSNSGNNIIINNSSGSNNSNNITASNSPNVRELLTIDCSIGEEDQNFHSRTSGASYGRSNSAPGSRSGHQFSLAREVSAAGLSNSDDEFWAGRAAFERSYQQLESAAGEVSSTFQNAREQMMDIQQHLQALRRQMEGLQDDLTSTSYTLTPDYSAFDSK